MKYMKLGDLPDTFYTEAATRTVSSDVPADLTIQINNFTYKLHKFPLILKCGLLQRLCSNTDDESTGKNGITLDDVPGGEEAFELCAKFCYGISIKLSAHNFVLALCAARFLRMTESIAKGNLIMKLESFFDSCILQGWRDSIIVLQEARRFSSWAESTVVGVANQCIDTVLRKILTPTSKVTWSYTYTRPGFDKKQQQRQQQVPKDWWTEDVADLDLDHFRSMISSLRSSKQLPPPLIGEALHVFTCKQLLDPSDPNPDNFTEEESVSKQRRILESIVSMIPVEYNSVSGRFLLRLLKVANLVDASPSTKAELVRRAGQRLHEVTAKDLLFPLPRDPESYDVGMVEAVLEIFLIQFRRPVPEEDADRMISSMIHVARTVDSYLQIISHRPNVPVSKIVQLVKCLPEMSRPDHDELYKSIDIYLKNHPDLNKSEKKQLCQLLDAQKLSPDMRSHAIRNDQLPLRTIVQLLFFEQENVHISSTLDVKKPVEEEEEEEESVEFLKKKSNKTMMMKKEQGVNLKKGEGNTSNYESNSR